MRSNRNPDDLIEKMETGLKNLVQAKEACHQADALYQEYVIDKIAGELIACLSELRLPAKKVEKINELIERALRLVTQDLHHLSGIRQKRPRSK